MLVLDNFEQVLDAAPLVAELLTAVAALRIMATSRAPLQMRGERSMPSDRSRWRRASTQSRQLISRARRQSAYSWSGSGTYSPTFAHGRQRPTVTAICRRLDALPLALELAAPWIKVLTAEDLLRRLNHDVLLSRPARAISPNASRRSMRRSPGAIGCWAERTARVPSSRRAAGAFSDQGRRGGPGRSRRSLPPATTKRSAGAGLIDKSLLLRAETSVATRPLYQMLETVRAYAAHELAASGERDDALAGWRAIARPKPPSLRRGWSD